MKLAFLGAGSAVFLRNVIGDCMLTEGLEEMHYALYDIDMERLQDSFRMCQVLNRNLNGNRSSISMHCGPDALPQALDGADFIINAIQVGGYEPATRADFDICTRHGLRMTIGDTMGPAGIFRALRTIPVLDLFASVAERCCPDAWFLNYTNPMAILSGYMQRYTGLRTVGLCHSVQVVVKKLLAGLEREVKGKITYRVAGINHMGWLLDVREDGKDIYPEIKRLSLQSTPRDDMVRHEIMKRFGYYVTESSEHLSEYLPYFIKKSYPEQIDRFAIPLDEYPRRCIKNIEKWKNMRTELVENPDLSHERSREYASRIIQGMVTDVPYEFNGNVINRGSIENLPPDACVEVPCIADSHGITSMIVGRLPEQCAALNMTNINVHQLAIQAAVTRRKEDVYMAAMLDPHTASELSLDEIRALCDDMFEANRAWIGEFR